MNRRDFIKTTSVVAASATIPLSSIGEESIGTLTGTTNPPTSCNWPYRVYCYEREQGEWVFSQNIRGSFAYQREYMTFDEEDDLSWNPHYATGWMCDGVLRFQTFDDATNFVDMHVRTKDDINIIDSIYDVYRHSDDGGAEIQVAHYWFNGDTGSQIHWQQEDFNTNFNKVESG